MRTSRIRRWLDAPVRVWFGISPLPFLLLLLNLIFSYYYGWSWSSGCEGKLDSLGRNYQTRSLSLQSQTGWVRIEYCPPWSLPPGQYGVPWKLGSRGEFYPVTHDERVQPLPGRRGFEYHVVPLWGSGPASPSWFSYEVRVPHWALLLSAALLTLPSLRRYRRQRRRRAKGLCLGCGYDLRGSPGRCPECGSSAVRTRTPADGPRPSLT